jgi:hypothetical protein
VLPVVEPSTEFEHAALALPDELKEPLRTRNTFYTLFLMLHDYIIADLCLSYLHYSSKCDTIGEENIKKARRETAQ